MLIEQPQAETRALIYKPIQLVLWGIDLAKSPVSEAVPLSLFRVTADNKGMTLKENDREVFTVTV